MLFAVFCVLLVVRYVFSVMCGMAVVRCVLFVVRCVVFVAYCLLCAVWCVARARCLLFVDCFSLVAGC